MERKSPFFSNRTYDFLKFFTQVVLPAIGSLYFGLASTWGLPHAEDVVGTIVLVVTFLGITLLISKSRYDALPAQNPSAVGQMVVTSDAGGPTGYSLELNGPAEGLAEMDHVTFKVVHKGDGQPLPPPPPRPPIPHR